VVVASHQLGQLASRCLLVPLAQNLASNHKRQEAVW